MKIRDRIEYGAVAGLLAVCRILPEAWVYAMCKALGMLSYLLLDRRRKTAYMNTGVVFPDMPPRERRRLVRHHFLNLAESMALNALVMCGRISNERFLGMVEAEHWDRTLRTLETSNKGFLFFSAHIGNWELVPLYAGIRLGDRKIHVIARQTTNRLLEERIIIPMRERFGVKVFYKKNAILKIMQATRKGDPAGIMIDQKLNLREGIANDFFGRTVGTTPAPAILQIRFGIDTVPIFMIRSGKWKYRLVLGEPVYWKDNGKPMEEQVAELTAIHQKIIEQIILRYPDQWFWVHDRWGLWKQGRKK